MTLIGCICYRWCARICDFTKGVVRWLASSCVTCNARSPRCSCAVQRRTKPKDAVSATNGSELPTNERCQHTTLVLCGAAWLPRKSQSGLPTPLWPCCSAINCLTQRHCTLTKRHVLKGATDAQALGFDHLRNLKPEAGVKGSSEFFGC